MHTCHHIKQSLCKVSCSLKLKELKNSVHVSRVPNSNRYYFEINRITIERLYILGITIFLLYGIAPHSFVNYIIGRGITVLRFKCKLIPFSLLEAGLHSKGI